MKFSWGTGIFLFYTLFALGLVFQVYKSTQYDHSLVYDDYYSHDIHYQEQYERKVNAQSLSEPVRISLQPEVRQVVIDFPADVIRPQGTVLLYRPNDKRFDQELPISMDGNGQMKIGIEDLLVGRWAVRITWAENGKEYFVEDEVNVPVL
ncbi:MAG: FixH family protein [Lewinella sp.]|nr:FixH family protein [Lewinella sp.]